MPVALRLIFAGTPEFAVPTLTALTATGHTIAAVLTQPDRPAGRGSAKQARSLRASAVKHYAQRAGLPILQPKTLRDAALQQQLAALQADALIVVAYGLLLPAAVLCLPQLGCINVHASLLPRWRGAAPIQRALLAGDNETGVSIMRMDAGLDTGPVYGQAVYPIPFAATAGALHDALAALGAQTLIDLLPGIADGSLPARAQNNDRATYAAKLSKAEAELDWRQTAITLERQVRAFNPWPLAYTYTANGQRLLIQRARAQAEPCSAPPGRVVKQDDSGIFVATGAGQLQLLELQLAGKRALPVAEFSKAQSLSGQRLGNAL